MYFFNVLKSLVILLCGFCFLDSYPLIFIGLYLTFIIWNIKNKFNVLVVLLNVFIGFLFYIVWLKIATWEIDDVATLIDQAIGYSLKDTIYLHLENIHSSSTASFLKLLLFGVKDKTIYSFYYQLIDLAVVHIIVIGGFHLSALCKIMRMIFKKLPKTGNCFSFLLILFVCYLNSFSIGCLRSLLFFIFSFFVKKRDPKLDLSVLFILLVVPQEILGFSFQMSFIAVLVIFVVSKNKIQNKIMSELFISLCVTLFLIPFVGIMNEQISLWAILYSWFLTPIFILIYFFSLMFGWFAFSEVVIYESFNLILYICNSLDFINVFIPLPFFKDYNISFYYLLAIFFAIYYFVEHKKVLYKQIYF